VTKESILQVKEVVAQYELKDVPAFDLKKNTGKYSFRIVYELLETNFSD